MAGSKKARKDESSSSSSSYDSESSSGSDRSGSSEDSDNERHVSGQKQQEQERPVDPKDLLLPDFCSPKEIASKVSDWAKNKVHGAFLGLACGKDEKKALVDKYYCSQEDFALFSAQTVQGKSLFVRFFLSLIFCDADSPLALIRGQNNASALSDLTKIHNYLLFSTRVGLIPYETLMDFQVRFRPAVTDQKLGVTSVAGDWSNLAYT